MALEKQASIPRKLWEHPDVTSTAIWKFKTLLEKTTNRKFKDYDALYRYSCQQRSDFWRFTFEYLPIVYSGTVPHQCVDESAKMDTVPRWFHGVKLNYAENILYVGDQKTGRRMLSPGKEDDKIAVTEVREGSFQEPIRHVTWGELRRRVGQLSNAMRAHGVGKGDRIAVVASTCVDTLVVFLATATVGALFSSSSTDMGTKGILDRVLQIKPKYLFMDDWAIYNGKKTDLRSKMSEVVAGMTAVAEFKGIVSQCRFPGDPADMSPVSGAQTWSQFVSKAESSDLRFESLDFNDPFLIVYSSGTTGTPKCIVHRIGGIVLNGHKEGKLHFVQDHTSTLLQYTTTGWIMYLVSIQALLVGARTITYDGSPFLPEPSAFIRMIGEQKVTHIGISPRYLSTLQAAKIIPRKVADLSNLTIVTSTGMVLPDAMFEWFYDEGFPPSAALVNISGGTDLAGCFGISSPMMPIYVGGCQCSSLGYAVEVFDQTIESPGPDGQPPIGRRLEDGVPGELVCTVPFPTMPVMFYGEDGAKKYFNSYFARFRHVWTHGDFIQINPVTRQIMFLGRADGVLNPSGVRFGSAEIYSVIEKHFPTEIQDSICVGQRRPADEDERVVLFLLMREGKRFEASLIKRVKDAIAKECSKRHVPKFVFETREIPTTVNLKKVELPVKQIVSGKIVKPSGTLLNPGSLEYYYRFAKDENLVQLENEPQKARAKL